LSGRNVKLNDPPFASSTVALFAGPAEGDADAPVEPQAAATALAATARRNRRRSRAHRRSAATMMTMMTTMTIARPRKRAATER